MNKDKPNDPKETEENVMVSANEKLLMSRSYVLMTVDGDKGGYSFHVNVGKLNNLEIHGFFKVLQDNINNLYDSLTLQDEIGNDLDELNLEDD